MSGPGRECESSNCSMGQYPSEVMESPGSGCLGVSKPAPGTRQRSDAQRHFVISYRSCECCARHRCLFLNTSDFKILFKGLASALYDYLITIHTMTCGNVNHNVRDRWTYPCACKGRAEFSIIEAAQSQVTGTAVVLSKVRNCARRCDFHGPVLYKYND